MFNPTPNGIIGTGQPLGGVPQNLGEIPPGVIPSPQRLDPNHPDAGFIDQDGPDTRSAAAGEGSGTAGDGLEIKATDVAGEA